MTTIHLVYVWMLNAYSWINWIDSNDFSLQPDVLRTIGIDVPAESGPTAINRIQTDPSMAVLA